MLLFACMSIHRSASAALVAASMACCGKEEPPNKAPEQSSQAKAVVTVEPGIVAPPEAPPDPNVFLVWVGQNRLSLHKLMKKTECYPANDPDFGWCDASMPVGESLYAVRWRKGEPGAVQAETLGMFKGRTELRCEHIGASKVRRWRWQGVGNCSHCNMANGALAGMHIYVKNVEGGAYLRVFSERFLALDTDFAKTLADQGATLP